MDLAYRIFPDVHVHGIAAHFSGQPEGELFAENKRTLDMLCGCAWDAVYNLNFSGLSFALAGLFDPDSVCGYRTSNGQRLKDPWMELAFRWTKDRRHSPLNLADFWALLAPEPLSPRRVNPTAEGRGGGVGVVVAGRHSRRSLPSVVMAQCVLAVVDRTHSNRVVLLGSGAEKAAAGAFKKEAGPRVLSLIEDRVGQTDWSGLIDLVSGLDVVLTPDTGTMHLAAHLGIPVEAFFLSSAWAWETGPYGEGHRVWQGMLDCAPCLESRPCPLDVQCLGPFTGRELLRGLSGGTGSLPSGLISLESGLDAVGVVYSPIMGLDDSALMRQVHRFLVAELRGIPLACPAIPPEAAQQFFQERDWMLEDQRNGYRGDVKA